MHAWCEHLIFVNNLIDIIHAFTDYHSAVVQTLQAISYLLKETQFFGNQSAHFIKLLYIIY